MHSCSSHQRKQSNKTEASASSVNPLRFIRSRWTKDQVWQEMPVVRRQLATEAGCEQGYEMRCFRERTGVAPKEVAI